MSETPGHAQVMAWPACRPLRCAPAQTFCCSPYKLFHHIRVWHSMAWLRGARAMFTNYNVIAKQPHLAHSADQVVGLTDSQSLGKEGVCARQ